MIAEDAPLRVVSHGTLVKWEGEVPRAVLARQWIAIRLHNLGLERIAAWLEPVPMNHPRCLEVVSISSDHAPITTYRRD